MSCLCYQHIKFKQQYIHLVQSFNALFWLICYCIGLEDLWTLYKTQQHFNLRCIIIIVQIINIIIVGIIIIILVVFLCKPFVVVLAYMLIYFIFLMFKGVSVPQFCTTCEGIKSDISLYPLEGIELVLQCKGNNPS